ncbi:MAG: D-2-hydroxyacid dehydrogenase family protein [Rhodospirillaceae bacterium]|jgi:phosphoglycerate dehydrogenase-like enzyme|nr:D-2-hydroxyacid dehydrogenase family protein [Rhodospirillaceae bacterium]
MKRIAILDDYKDVARRAADWESLPETEVTVFTEHIADEDVLADVLAPFEVLVIMRERTAFPKSLLDRLPNLGLLVTTGMRNLSVDMAAARDNGVVVCGTQMMRHVPFELAWALIMAITKKIPAEDRSMHEGGWHHAVGIGLKGKTLGILGLGSLGTEVAKIGIAFDMSVIAWSENLTAERAADVGVTRVEKDELFAQSDVLSIHLLLSERTTGIVGAQELAKMKPTAYLINTARGPIVDEPALIKALQEKKIAGAALDVFDVEPLPADHPFRKLDNTVLTGHTGYTVQELYPFAYGQAVEDIAGWLKGDPVRVLNAPDKA